MKITEEMRVIIFESKAEYKEEVIKLMYDDWSELDEDYNLYSDGEVQATFFRHPKLK